MNGEVAAKSIATSIYLLLRNRQLERAGNIVRLTELCRRTAECEVRILQMRYGQAYTAEEVGRKKGVTRERVRQIEA